MNGGASGAGTVVAIDGPAGSGKSSVARAAAAALGFRFLDTGAAYRAVAWYGAETAADLDDPAVVAALADELDFEEALDPAEHWVRSGGQDITTAIREPRISAIVSKVSTVQPARDALNERFRRIIADAAPGIVVEGRDITTVVAPDADVRVLLTAAPEVRAARRHKDLEAAGDDADHAAVLAAIAERDRKDSTLVEFLSAAPGVRTVDSTHLDFDETVNAVVALVRSRG